MKLRNFRQICLGSLVLSAIACLVAGESAPVGAGPQIPTGFNSRANASPRKIVVGSALADFSGSLAARLQLAVKLLDHAARDAGRQYGGHGLDVMVFPEFALCIESGATAAERAVPLSGQVLDVLGAKARELHTWVVIPMTLR